MVMEYLKTLKKKRKNFILGNLPPDYVKKV